MKKITKVLLGILAATTVLTGCGQSAASSSSSQQNDTQASSDTSTGDASTTDTGSSGKTLVIYYSATGNTKAVVESIADKTGGDLYEVTPSDPYTDDDLDWTNDSSRVNREHNDESLQDVKFDSYDIPNFDSYDTVFVGYPIWWGDASWVMKSFVKNVDFSGKTVIPFCTSSSSGIGDSGKNLAKTAGTGNWLDGQRFSENASADEVGSWVDSLNL